MRPAALILQSHGLFQKPLDVPYGDDFSERRTQLPQRTDPLGRAAVQAALLYGARARRTRHAGAQCGADLLHAHVDRSDRGARLRRGQGVRAGRRIDAEPLFALSAQPRGGRLSHHLRRQGARRRAGRRRRLRRDRHALLGRRAGLRLGRGGLQQYLGGEGLAQLHAAVHRLHRRGGHYADSVGRRQHGRALCRSSAGDRLLRCALHAAVGRRLAAGHLGDVLVHLCRGAQYAREVGQRRHGGHRRRHALPRLPVGVRLAATLPARSSSPSSGGTSGCNAT